MLALAGCAPIPVIDVSQETVEVSAPPEPVAVPEPQREPAPPPTPAAPVERRDTFVLLSDDIPEFESIAREIEARSDHVTVLNLDGSMANVSRVRREAEEAERIVAVGLLAATVGREISGTPMVFCQVFNYLDAGLISASSKGVNFLPPFDAQLARWKELAPGVDHVGIITGPNQGDLLAEIRTAAERHDVELTVRNVSSDKEALFEFKRIVREIDGLWLLPDNRILSPDVVREIMSYSALHQKQIVVFGANLLEMGGLMSVTSDPADVAEQVLARLEQVTANGQLDGPGMRPLTEIQVRVNRNVARALGIEIPQTFASASGNGQ